jgi:hypothetical protein
MHSIEEKKAIDSYNLHSCRYNISTQLCVSGVERKPGKVIVATPTSGAFPRLAELLSGQYRNIIRPICAGAEVQGDILLMAAIDIK